MNGDLLVILVNVKMYCLQIRINIELFYVPKTNFEKIIY